MADVRYGLRPVQADGSANNYCSLTECYIPASYATALFIGDPVVITGTSNTAVVKGRQIGTMPEINKATAAGGAASVSGVICAFLPDIDVATTVLHNAASTERIALVCTDPNQLFSIQCSGTMAATDVGLNGDLVYTHAGDTATGLSGAEFNTTGKATTATLQLKIMKFDQDHTVDAPNTIGANSKVIVKINTHTNAPASAGI